MFFLCFPEDVIEHVVTVMWDLKSVSYLDKASTNSSHRNNFLLQIQKIHIVEDVVLSTFNCASSSTINDLNPPTYELCKFLSWVKKRKMNLRNATISMKCSDKINNPDHWNQQLNAIEIGFSDLYSALNHLTFYEISTLYSGYETYGKRKLENIQMRNQLYNNVGQFASDTNCERVRFVGIINKFNNLSSLCFTSMGHDDKLLMSIAPEILNQLTSLHLESLWESTAMSLLALSYLADNCRSMKSFRLVCEYTSHPSDQFSLPELHLINLLTSMPQLEFLELKCKGIFTDNTFDTILQNNTSLHTIKLGMICGASCVEHLNSLILRSRLVYLEFGVHPALRWYNSDDTPNFIYQNNGVEKNLTLVNSTSDPDVREQDSFLQYDSFDQFFVLLKGLSKLTLHGIFSSTILKHIVANHKYLRQLRLRTIKNKRFVLLDEELKYLRNSCESVVIR